MRKSSRTLRVISSLVKSSDELLDRNHDRRIRDDSQFAVDDVGQLGERAHAVLRLRLGDDAVERLRRFFEFSASRRAPIASASSREYQTSRLPMSANSRIALR